MTGLVEQAARRHRWTIRRAAIMAMAASASAILLLAISGWFLTGAALAGLGGVAAVASFNYLLPSAAIRALAIIRTLARYGERYVSHQAVVRSLADIRSGLFASWLAAPPALLLRSDSGDLLAGLTGDVDALDTAILRKAILPSAFAIVSVAVAMAALAGPLAACLSLLSLAASFLIGRHLASRWLPAHARAVADARADFRRTVDELMAGTIDMHVYGLVGQVDVAVSDAATALDAARRAEARAEGWLMVIHAALSAVSVALMAVLASAPLPLLALGLLAQIAAMEAMGTLVRLDVGRLRTAAAQARLDRLTTCAIAGTGPVVPDSAGLAFRQGARSVLVPQGGRLAITGRSGAGKTRLLRSLVGLEAAGMIDVSIGDIPLSLLPPAQRRMAFAYAAQDAPMLAGTLADNLALARSGIDRTEMEAALATACLDQLVQRLPDGLDTWLGEDGARLSGGERKRLGLARALLAGRPWLLLDEPSEGLDAATEAMLVTQLERWLADTATGLVLVSHRPAMLALAGDQRLSLD
ncbi:ATP-binding cassette domain-containing protein [Sphingomonas lacunae]|uniref:ATP-binding cassette domain-containing protein n=1 Tax=Sphingomonas lacunae TaxID=2698828 RepID=A0A6M4AQ62_9SPHN|nr:ATP-binding cassette domain-containing protein [Sphingomonas lacunae]QJQ31165.1 ATP-binding cassette domain-containing protein [Sphingomonas lacunae]